MSIVWWLAAAGQKLSLNLASFLLLNTVYEEMEIFAMVSKSKYLISNLQDHTHCLDLEK